MYLARNVPYFLTNEEIDRAGAEWRVYAMADIPIEWIQKQTNSSENTFEYISVDKYWYHVLCTTTSTGAPQYLSLAKLVKCLLSLSHGNSDVERGFSQNNNVISDDRSSLNEASINGLRATNAGIKFFGDGKTHMVTTRLIYSSFFILFFKVSTTSTLISNVQDAYSRYAKDKEQQQKLIKHNDVVNSKRTSDIEREESDEKENQLMKEQKSLQEELTNATKMLEEGSARLLKAVSDKEFNDIGVAEVLVTAANTKLTVLKNQLIENSQNLNQLRKKQKK